jgi:hypothetical protein
VESVVLGKTQWWFPPTQFVFQGDPRPYTDGVNTAPYPSVVLTVDGVGQTWNELLFSAPANPNSTRVLGGYGAWLPNSSSGCPAALIPSGLIENGTIRTYSVSVGAIAFKNDHLLHEYSTGNAIDPTDGTTFVWTAGGTINKPAAYTWTTKVWVVPRFDFTPAINGTMQGVQIRVKKGTDVVGGPWTYNFTGSWFAPSAVELNITEYAVKISNVTLAWEISEGSGNWRSIGNSGPHKIYWTMGNPLSPTFKNSVGTEYAPLYDSALEKACAMANGQTTSVGAFNGVTAGVAAAVTYSPAVQLGNQHPLTAFNQGCLCTDHVNLARGLLRSIGLDCSMRYLFTGPSTTSRRFYRTQNGTWVTAQFNRPAADGVAAQPHFEYHAVLANFSLIPNTFFDPSYGDSYASGWTALEKAPNMVERAEEVWPMATGYDANFVCPH